MMRKTGLFVLLLLLLTESCTIQKRRYLKGFHVQRVFQAPQKTGHDQAQETASADKTFSEQENVACRKDSVTPGIIKTKKEQISLEEEILPANSHLHAPSHTKHSLEKVNLHTPILQQSLKPIEPKAKTKPLPVAQKFSKQADGWTLVIIILIVAGLIFPPLINVLIDNPLWIILNILVWAAGVVFIVLNIASTGWIIALILLWHIIHFVLFFMIYNP